MDRAIVGNLRGPLWVVGGYLAFIWGHGGKRMLTACGGDEGKYYGRVTGFFKY